MRSKRIKGSALFYALLLATIIAILLTAMIALWAANRQLTQRNQILRANTNTHQSALAWLLSQGVEQQSRQLLLSEVMDDAGTSVEEQLPSLLDSTRLKTDFWGYFRLLHYELGRQFNLHPNQGRSALVGQVDGPEYTLVLPENRQPIKLVGNSSISGDVLINQATITAGKIDDRPYTGGTPHRAGQSLAYPLGFDALAAFEFPDLDLPASIFTSDLTDTLRPFGVEPTRLPTQKQRILRGAKLSGQIVIEADSLIRVGADCQLEDVILLAPEIIIESGFTGSFQAFASESIQVEDNCTLKFPTNLVLWPPDLARLGVYPKVRLGEGVRLWGGIFGRRGSDRNRVPLFSSGANCDLHASVIWEGAVMPSGRLRGSLVAKNFVLRSGQQERINYVADFQLSGPSPNQVWTYPYFLGDGDLNIAKWVP